MYYIASISIDNNLSSMARLFEKTRDGVKTSGEQRERMNRKKMKETSLTSKEEEYISL